MRSPNVKKAARLVNRALQPAGVRLFRSDSLGRDWHVLFEHVAGLGFSPSHVIDVGAGLGTTEIYEHFPNAFLHLYEPLTECLPSLNGLANDREARVVHAVVGAAPGSTTLNVHSDLIGSSVLREVEGGGDDGHEVVVDVVTLDGDLSDVELTGGVLMKIDVQGFELEVLAGAPETLDACDLVIIESSLIATMQGGAEIIDVMRAMDDAGFVLFDLIGGLERPLDGSLAQVDAVFVKSESPWRSDRRWRSD